ncbi:sensor histidine kinase [Actinomadura sp. WMMB 499]|uniref:sensor histidine kinase n=1 Tax=Actinomadura sp. WMMB 499 TaxID=1219491 RepID=UPI00159D0989|nr:histidine kinase [Actinomadura sp. WMMB 499]
MEGRRGFALDLVTAFVVVVVNVFVAGNLLKDRDDFTPWFLGSVFVALGLGCALCVRRRWPLGALYVALGLSGAATVAGLLWEPFVVVAFVLYLVAVQGGSRRALVWCCGVALVSTVLGQAVRPRWEWPFAAGWTLVGVGLCTAMWAIGRLVRARRRNAELLERQREHQIVTDERLRIAREMHDVVTHGMGLIAVKSGIANHIAAERPAEAREALRVIEATSREALGEMRRLLGVLRDGAEPPPPGLAGLADIAERVRAAGVRVELSLKCPDGLPDGVGLAVHRIVQEAVTNVVKHAAPARCEVRVRDDRGVVRIEVVDDGSGGRGGGGGHGLVGMRERVAVYGGRFMAGPLPGGGFRVVATLPYGADAPPREPAPGTDA